MDIFILVGVPAAGKSTWVQKTFQGECVVISSDDIIEDVARSQNSTYDAVFKQYVKVADAMMWKNLDKAIEERQNPIVIDRTNMSIKARARIFDRMKRFYPNHPYKFHAVVFPTPERTEHQRRLANRPGKTIPSAVIQSMVDSYQCPTITEGFTTVQVGS